MQQAKVVQISIHHLWLMSQGQPVLNLHSPSVTQVQLAPTCIHNLLLNIRSSTSSNLHSPSVILPNQEDAGVAHWQDHAGDPSSL